MYVGMHVWVSPRVFTNDTRPKLVTVPARTHGQDMYIYIWIHTYLNRSIDTYMDIYVCMHACLG